MEKRILLVEDEEHLIDVIKLNLELEQYIVKVAEDGKQAIDLWQSQRFDLILLDVMLPNVDGLTVCETIRLKDEEIPILILSAKGGNADKILGLKAGADDYLLKPFNLFLTVCSAFSLIEQVFNNIKSASLISFVGLYPSFVTIEATTSLSAKFI